MPLLFINSTTKYTVTHYYRGTFWGEHHAQTLRALVGQVHPPASGQIVRAGTSIPRRSSASGVRPREFSRGANSMSLSTDLKRFTVSRTIFFCRRSCCGCDGLRTILSIYIEQCARFGAPRNSAFKNKNKKDWMTNTRFSPSSGPLFDTVALSFWRRIYLIPKTYLFYYYGIKTECTLDVPLANPSLLPALYRRWHPLLLPLFCR